MRGVIPPSTNTSSRRGAVLTILLDLSELLDPDGILNFNL
jgi:hypothetical protein